MKIYEKDWGRYVWILWPDPKDTHEYLPKEQCLLIREVWDNDKNKEKEFLVVTLEDRAIGKVKASQIVGLGKKVF
jgi:hypothetical protein